MFVYCIPKPYQRFLPFFRFGCQLLGEGGFRRKKQDLRQFLNISISIIPVPRAPFETHREKFSCLSLVDILCLSVMGSLRCGGSRQCGRDRLPISRLIPCNWIIVTKHLPIPKKTEAYAHENNERYYDEHCNYSHAIFYTNDRCPEQKRAR